MSIYTAETPPRGASPDEVGEWAHRQLVRVSEALSEVEPKLLSCQAYTGAEATPNALELPGLIGPGAMLRYNGELWVLLETVGWVPLISSQGMAVLAGDLASFTLTATPYVFTDYPTELEAGGFRGSVDPVAGTITLPAAGIYQLTTWARWAQENSTKEEMMFLGLRRVGGANPGDLVLSGFDVATDKTDYRFFGAAGTFAGAAGEVWSMFASATAGMGTQTGVMASWTVDLLRSG